MSETRYRALNGVRFMGPTEQAWLTSTDPAWMLRTRLGENSIIGNIQGWQEPTDRELRLVAQAAACAVMYIGWKGWQTWADRSSSVGEMSSDLAARWWCGIAGTIPVRYSNTDENQIISHIIREVMGNPFRPLDWHHCPQNVKTVKHGGVLNIDPSLRTKEVLEVVELLYQTRENNQLDSSLLLVLADELEAAGCPVEALGHQGVKRTINTDKQGRCRACAGTGLVPREKRTQRNIWYPCLECRANQSPGLVEHLRGKEKCSRCYGEGSEYETGAGFEYEITCKKCKGSKVESPNHVYGCWVVEFLRNGDKEWKL